MDFYLRFTRQGREFSDIVYDCKRLVLRALMSGEQNVLARKLDVISEQHRWSRDFTLNSLGRVLAEVIACFPVYRSYVSAEGSVSSEDRRRVMAAVNAAKRRNAVLSESTFNFLTSVLLLKHPDGLDDAARAQRLDFVLRFQQLTSPVMAKGFEDTALYRVYPLASLNEVGGDPTSVGVPIEAFHASSERRLREWPHALSATSTHDTKRGEDVRARINVLSEVPDAWEQAMRRWSELNRPLSVEWEDTSVPDANEEYLFYQTLVGTWPLTTMTLDEHEQFVKRIQEYLNKSAKEAKVRTAGSALTHPMTKRSRRLSVRRFSAIQRIAFSWISPTSVRPSRMAGMLNSLSQTSHQSRSAGGSGLLSGKRAMGLQSGGSG